MVSVLLIRTIRAGYHEMLTDLFFILKNIIYSAITIVVFLLAPLINASAKDKPLFKPQVSQSEDSEFHLEASMWLLKDTADQGVYAITVSLKNTSPDQEITLTEGRYSGDLILVQILHNGKYLSDSSVGSRAAVTPDPKTIKILPLQSHEWVFPIADYLKEKMSDKQVIKNCYIGVSIIVPSNPPRSIDLHDSNVNLTSKSLERNTTHKSQNPASSTKQKGAGGNS